MNYYELLRDFWNFAFENPEKITPNHCALYCFTVEHCNRLGWKSKFGLPTSMAKEAIGIHSYNTYAKTLTDLCEWGFIKMVEKSKNQYSSNIVALSKFNKATNKALDKATIKHVTKQSESTVQSNSSIIIPINNNTNLPINKLDIDNRKLKFASTLEPFLPIYGRNLLNDFYAYWTEENPSKTKFRAELERTWSVERRLATWAKNDKNFNPNSPKKYHPR